MTAPTSTKTIAQVLKLCKYDHALVPDELLPLLGTVDAQSYVDKDGLDRATFLDDALTVYNKAHEQAPITLTIELIPLANALDDVLETQAKMKPNGGVATATATVTTATMTTTVVQAMRDDDVIELPGTGDVFESASGFGSVGAQFDVDALRLAGEASMALLFVDAGVLRLVQQQSFWQKLNLKVKHPLRAKIDEVMTALEDVENLTDKAVVELRDWLIGAYPEEFMTFIETVAKLGNVKLATALGGKQSTADVGAMADQLGELMALLPLIAERVTVYAEQSAAPNRVVRLVKAVKLVTTLLKDRELHAYVGQQVAQAKTDNEGAILLIQYLAGTTADGLKMVNQIRAALGYEAVWDGLAGFLLNQTVKNLTIAGNRGRNLWAAFKMLKEGSASSASSFRPQPSASAASIPSAREIKDTVVRTVSGWTFSISFKFGD